jgi:hypothetical protein
LVGVGQECSEDDVGQSPFEGTDGFGLVVPGRDGEVIRRYEPNVTPEEIRPDIAAIWPRWCS